MEAKAWKRNLAAVIKSARRHSDEHASERLRELSKFAAYNMLQLSVPRYFGTTSAIMYLRRSEDIVIVANETAIVEANVVLAAIKERIDGDDVVQDTSSIYARRSVSGIIEAIGKLEGDIWFDSCLPSREVLAAVFKHVRQKRADNPPLIICSGFLLRLSDAE